MESTVFTRSHRELMAVTVSVPVVDQEFKSLENSATVVTAAPLVLVLRTNSRVRCSVLETVSKRASGKPRTPVVAAIVARSEKVGSRLSANSSKLQIPS